MIRSALLTVLCALPFALTSCTPKETQALLAPENALGLVLAEQTGRAVGPRKQIVVITADASWGPTSAAEAAFRTALKKEGVVILSTKAANLGDPMRSGTIGLKPADLLEVIEKFPDAGAIVSFAGVPLLQPGQAQFPTIHPPILAVATANLGTVPGVPGKPLTVLGLIEAKVVQMAILDAQGQSGDSLKADAAHQLFAQHFQILHAPELDSH